MPSLSSQYNLYKLVFFLSTNSLNAVCKFHLLFFAAFVVISRFYLNQKKTMEINPRHPLVQELRQRVENDESDQTTIDLAKVLYDTAVLRSGFFVKDTATFAGRIERMLRLSLGVDPDLPVSCCSQSLWFFL